MMRGKSVFKSLIMKDLYLKVNGFPYSRHRSKRIEKKLRKRAQPLIWIDEAKFIKDLGPITFKHEFKSDMVDAFAYAFASAPPASAHTAEKGE